MKTYTVRINGGEITVKGLKSEAEGIIRELERVIRLPRYARELNGTIGGRESQCVLFSPFSPMAPITDEAGYQAAMAKLTSDLPAVLTPLTFAPFRPVLKGIFDTHIPIKDNRQTPEQVETRQAQTKAVVEAHDAARRAWQAQYCPGEPIGIPPGGMAVYLELTYDDSDGMTDYYAPHCQLGEDMLLAVVPKQAKTERLARSILSRYSELNGLKWAWHTENYSMGHGNYLESEYLPETVRHGAYDGRTEVSIKYEIRFSAYTKELRPYRDYPGNAPKEHREPATRALVRPV